MTAYPKHYLAEVPHELRMRVLDLCVHRQWHDALDLLHQNSFTQYEWYELVWFHDHAPTNLDPVTCAVPSVLSDRSADSQSASTHVVPASAGPQNCEPRPETPQPTLSLNTAFPSSIQEPASLTLTPHPEPRVNPNTLPIKPKRRCPPRSKACRLPADVQLSLNTMLAGGCRYRDIIRILNTRGYPGFNKANLNAWKRTGFQDWLKTCQAGACPVAEQSFSVTDQRVLVTDSNP